MNGATTVLLGGSSGKRILALALPDSLSSGPAYAVQGEEMDKSV